MTDYERGLRDGREAERRDISNYLRWMVLEAMPYSSMAIVNRIALNFENGHHRKERG